MTNRVTSVDNLPTSYLKCRALGHSWEEFIDNSYTPSFGHLLALTCTSCTMVRYDVIDTKGDVAHRRYKQPVGYKLDMPSDRAELRLTLLDREDRKQRARAVRKRIAQPRHPSTGNAPQTGLRLVQ